MMGYVSVAEDYDCIMMGAMMYECKTKNRIGDDAFYDKRSQR